MSAGSASATSSAQRVGAIRAAGRVRGVRVVTERCEVAIVGSGFAGSLMARCLAVLGYDVVLLERSTHPRFAIGESSAPLANLSLERLGVRYGLDDCYQLATHGRWLDHFPELRRGLKRGFTFYRHHPGESFANRGLDSERLLVAASPIDALGDTHWVRADVDHHFVRQAVAAGVDYRDRVEVTSAEIDSDGVLLCANREGIAFTLSATFLIDASGPGGFLARQLSIPSGPERTETRSALVWSHFDGVQLMRDVEPGLPPGPYPDDWAAVHHIIDEGWMYSLRFDHGVTSAGFLLKERAPGSPQQLWRHLLHRYPTIGALFANAQPLMPLAYKPRIQHRLTRAAGTGWAMLPHAYAFVDPLFSTGIAWSLRAIERLGLLFEKEGGPTEQDLARYDAALSHEADQIDTLVAGAYHAMARFDLFAAHAMIYFAAVSFAEIRQRVMKDDEFAWSGFLGVGDPQLGGVPRASLRRLRHVRTPDDRRRFVQWVTKAIAPRNVCGLANRAAHGLYPVDLDVLLARHAVLGLSRESLVSALPALRGG